MNSSLDPIFPPDSREHTENFRQPPADPATPRCWQTTTKRPDNRIAALKAQLVETQDAGTSMVVLTIRAMGATPEQMVRLADEYQEIADGRQRSRITAIIARKVAARLRNELL